MSLNFEIIGKYNSSFIWFFFGVTERNYLCVHGTYVQIKKLKEQHIFNKKGHTFT
jgi:hypothetical protein